MSPKCPAGHVACRALALVVALLASASAAAAERPLEWYVKQAPRLPKPKGRVVAVSNEAQLQAAVRRCRSRTTIAVKPGTYKLTNTLHFAGPARHVAIRGTSGDPRDVVLVGRGMANKSYGNVPHGILVSNVQDILIADLTVRDVWFHPISFQGHAGCQRPRVYHCRLINAGEQFIKSNPRKDGSGVDGGRVEYTVMEYPTTARHWYTNGVDVLGGRGWVVRHCVFRNIRSPKGHRMAGPAVLMWRGTSDSVCEANLFLNCQFGIAFGLSNGPKPDHVGGIIRNNMFHRSRQQSGDVAIAVWNSPRTQVLHNTVVLSGTYPNAIEYRFTGSSGCTIAHNLTDSRIARRDGAQGTLTGSVTRAARSWFVDVEKGDLHLTTAARGVIDRAPPLKAVARDFDGQSRRAARPRDVGADEVLAARR